MIKKIFKFILRMFSGDSNKTDLSDVREEEEKMNKAKGDGVDYAEQVADSGNKFFDS